MKNKVAPPFREAEFDIMYNEGISSVGSLLDLALEFDIMQKRGSWFSYNGTQIAQGRDGTKDTLKTDKPLYDEIEILVKAKLNPEPVVEEKKAPVPSKAKGISAPEGATEKAADKAAE